MKKLNNRNKNSKRFYGFSIIELVVVIAIIGILAAVTIATYIGTVPSSRDASVQSDIDTMDALQTNYGTKNGVSGKAYYSPNGYDASLEFNVSSGNVIDVVINSTDYCIRGFNPSGTKNSIWNAFIKESSSGVCAQLSPSTSAIAASSSGAPLSPVADWVAVTQGDHYGNFYNLVGKNWATVARAASAGAPSGTTGKTIFDSSAQKIYDIPANSLSINPRSDGKNGNEAVIEESRTNYATNSYGASNDGYKWNAGWSFTGVTATTPTYSIEKGVYSNTAQRIRYTSPVGEASGHTYAQFFTPVGSFAPGDNYTASYYIKGSASGCRVGVYIDAWSSAWVNLGAVATSDAALGSNFQKVTYSYNNLPAGTSFVRIVPAYITEIDAGDTVDVTFDAAQIEKGTFATSYIPTTTTAVTRNADSVTVPTTGWVSNKGSILTVVGAPKITAGVNPRLITAVGASGYIVFSTTTAAQVDINTNVSSVWGSDVYAGTISSMGVAGYTWDTTVPTHIAYLNSVPGASNSGVSDTGAFSSASFGLSTYGGSAINGSLQRVVIYSSALSGSNVTTVTNAIKDGP